MRKTVTSTHSRSPAIGLSLLMCLVVAMAADLFGWSAALDAELGAVWFALRGERRSAHRVVLVAADPDWSVLDLRVAPAGVTVAPV